MQKILQNAHIENMCVYKIKSKYISTLIAILAILVFHQVSNSYICM